MALLVTVSTVVDNKFRAIHQGGSIGFTSMLIIVRLPSIPFLLPISFVSLNLISLKAIYQPAVQNRLLDEVLGGHVVATSRSCILWADTFDDF